MPPSINKKSVASRAITDPIGRADVRLGRREPNSLAPAVFAIVERGCLKRPELVDDLRFRAELRLTGGYPVIRVTFAEAVILVEDAPPTHVSGFDPDVVVEGALPDLLAIVATPTYAGLPKLTHEHGRGTIASLVSGRVRFRGNLLRARELIRLLRI